MSRSTLRVLAVILSVLIIIVIGNALDHLPGAVRAQIDSERAALASANTQLRAAQDEVAREVQAEPELFRTIPSSQQYPARFTQAAAVLQSASHDMEELSRLEKSGHHRDRERAESLLSRERQERTTALAQASGVTNEADHWINLKRHLPEQVQAMDRDYRAIHAFDFTPLTTAIQRAETDWPEKKPDLESRAGNLRGMVAQSDNVWQSTAELRRQAGFGAAAGLDYGTLFSAGDWLKASAADLPKKSDEVKALGAQLYDSWDKVLVDMEVRGSGSAKQYDQKIRTVRTHLPDASANNGVTTSEEKWVDVPKPTYEAMRNDLGMAIEHKPAGKYDTEAERVAQPAGFAYVAPPSQGSNQYGRWEHRDGRDFWVFYGQYALLRDLLFNHDYRPLDRGEWDGYRTYQQRGQTYYGNDATAGQSAPKYGTGGTATQNRYSGSTFAKGGGFRDSQYATKSGGYRDSKYASQGDNSPKRFGTSRRPEEPHAAPPPHSYRPAPSRPPMRSPGRSFGRRR